jgi:hypothetical protein
MRITFRFKMANVLQPPGGKAYRISSSVPAYLVGLAIFIGEGLNRGAEKIACFLGLRRTLLSDKAGEMGPLNRMQPVYTLRAITLE